MHHLYAINQLESRISDCYVSCPANGKRLDVVLVGVRQQLHNHVGSAIVTVVPNEAWDAIVPPIFVQSKEYSLSHEAVVVFGRRKLDRALLTCAHILVLADAPLAS